LKDQETISHFWPVDIVEMILITRFFPLLAIVTAAAAYIAPGMFTPMGDAIVPLLTLIMFSMGLTLTMDSFRDVLKTPGKIIVGTLMQFLLMPLAAFLIALGLSMDSSLMTGLVLVGCCPGGTASNVICYLARGNLALSISLTMVSTLLSVVATPLLTWVYLGQAIDVPITDMMLSILQIVIVPVVAGLLLNTWIGGSLKKMEWILPLISVLAIIVIIGIVVALNRDNLAVMSVAVFFAVMAHNALGIGGAYGLGKLIGYEESTCRTLAIEVGMQNSGLGVALATQFYTTAATLPGAVFSLWHNLSGSLLAGFWGKHDEKQ